MLSSAVEPWERADEDEVCSNNFNGFVTGGSSNSFSRDPDYPKANLQSSQVSRCPIEDGVVHTSRWGTVSPGTVLAAIAAALEPQQVQISLLLNEPVQTNDTDKLEKFERYRQMTLLAQLHNTWAATLAGDLAEVAVYQGPRLKGDLYLGPGGTWNDTKIPRVHYMDQRNGGFWQMTDAEARGGIDGLILSGAVQSWKEQLSRLRLSQLLEMYYSDRGVNFDTQYRACERQARLAEIRETSDLLLIQTINFARVLSYKSPEAVQISDEKLEEFSSKALQAYNSHLSSLLSALHCNDPLPFPRVHLDVILDGTWTTYEAMQVLAYLAQEADVSYYGSSMAVMNGEDATWILRETHNASDLFSLRNNTENSSDVTWPRSLNLKLSLATFSSYLAERLAEQRRRNVIGGPSHVILVLGYTATISDRDHRESVQIISRFKQQNPDVRFVFLASNINHLRFKELSTIDPSYPDVTIALPDSKVETVVTKIIEIITTIPGRITGGYCDGSSTETRRNGFEGYVTAGFPLTYRIHPLYLEHSGDVTLTFQGSGHGNLRACVSRDRGSTGTDCSEVKNLEEMALKISSPCANYAYQCPPVYLTITVTNTLTRCTEDDCRYPDQVRFLLHQEGLRCTRNPYSADSDTDVAPRSNSDLTLHVILQTVSLVLISKLIARF
ncbi:hypothetical protein B7P43_G16547 [Cryptotermes secundus]|uniref:Uncharacterized protein n=2 Tax=Cryptotermes secundus TaxID=105785 RepID=A0A2J7R0E2_9NEOP|nr:hypothetical protein B7P43_G16547 [Cryptotermes secundus]